MELSESRPELSHDLDSRTFREYYYLKEELVVFCRNNHLPTSGGKQELTERITSFLDTGDVRQPAARPAVMRKNRCLISASSTLRKFQTVHHGRKNKFCQADFARNYSFLLSS